MAEAEGDPERTGEEDVEPSPAPSFEDPSGEGVTRPPAPQATQPPGPLTDIPDPIPEEAPQAEVVPPPEETIPAPETAAPAPRRKSRAKPVVAVSEVKTETPTEGWILKDFDTLLVTECRPDRTLQEGQIRQLDEEKVNRQYASIVDIPLKMPARVTVWQSSWQGVSIQHCLRRCAKQKTLFQFFCLRSCAKNLT